MYRDIGNFVGVVSGIVAWIVCSFSAGFLGFAAGWTPQKIREKGVELGLMVKKEECVYAYSDEIKKHFG